MDSLFCCPLCGGTLQVTDSAYLCTHRHTFDRAAKGDVKLLPPNRKNSKEPGDDIDSLRARQRFLNAGFYAPLAERIAALATAYPVSEANRAIEDSASGRNIKTILVK